MSELPIELYKTEQIRALEQTAQNDFGIPMQLLMERAGRSAFDVLLDRFPDCSSIAVICGSGNNAGDGYVLARLALQHELNVTIYAIGKQAKLSKAANAAAKSCHALGVPIKPFSEASDLDVDVIIDAVLGIGITGDVTGDVELAILAMNAANKPILSMDVPSGLDANTGHVCGHAVQATVTVTFLGMKQGLLTGEARQYCGELLFDDLQLPEKIYANVPITAIRIESVDIQELLLERKRDAHKGDFGHVLVIGGDYGKGGAVRLTGEAALRSGAGLVTVATRKEHVAAIISARPELMCLGIENPDELAPLLAKASVIALGPGLGDSDWGKALYQAALASGLPMVIDAEALGILAKSPVKRDNWILTPHPGEAARLLALDVPKVQADRFAAAMAMQSTFGGVVVLKGAGTLIQRTDALVEIAYNGNPGMASAGMGDLLTGVIAALCAQGYSLMDAARLGVWAHGYAGDVVATETGERGMLALDLLPHIHLALNELADNEDELFLDDEFGMLGDLVVPSANDEDD